jgi:hypothetical protein
MKSIRKILGGLAIIGSFIALSGFIQAQVTIIITTPAQGGAASLAANVDWRSASDLEVMLQAVEQTSPLSAESAPKFGTFYSAQYPNWPPLLGNINNLPAWNLGNSIWLLADQDFDYAALEQQNAALHEAVRQVGLEMDDEDTGSTFTIDTNGLWLEITNVSNGFAYLNLHNATDQVYAIWDTTNLLADWQVEMEVWPTNQDVMPFTVPMLERQNLFLRAEDWMGVDSDGDGIPDWWIFYWFGNLSATATNLDSSGLNTLGYDYNYQLAPNMIAFSCAFSSQRVNTSMVTGAITVLSGFPSGIAVLIDNTNFETATWIPYVSSNLTVNLGSVQGPHEVWVGLRVSPMDTQPLWEETILDLDSVPPVITITHPIAGSTVSQPFIQLQGFANVLLSNLTFDVSNAAGVFTNLTGYVTGQFYDTNFSEFTTNYFQGYNVPLTNGWNVITVHATDLKGNAGSSAVSCNLDYSSDHTAPALSVVWPPDGTYISGGDSTLQVQVDDITANITVTITDASGDTNSVNALIEQNGMVWAQLPLLAGTNTLTVTATDAAGNTCTTNLTLYQSSVLATVQPLTTDQLNRPLVTVYGTVSDATVQVFVNEVAASVTPDAGDASGVWEADGVPVSPTGTAILDVELYAGVGDTMANANVRFQPLNDFHGQSVGSERSVTPQPVTAATASYASKVHFHYPLQEVYTENQWTYGVGGTWASWGHSRGNESPYESFSESDNGTFSLDGTIVDIDGYLYENSFGPPWAHVAYSGDAGISDFYIDDAIDSKVMLMPSGRQAANGTNIYLVAARAAEFSAPPDSDTEIGTAKGGSSGYDGDWPMPPEWLQIREQTLVNSGITNDDGSVWGETLVSAPAGVNVDVTPVATQYYNYNDYTFDVKATELDLQLAVDANRDGNIMFDATDQTTVGQPYRFWVNNDHDGYDSSIDDYDDLDPSTGSDADNTSISCTRDLEDYARLWINTQGITEELQSGTFRLALEWKNTIGYPGIRIFPAVETDGGALYLTDESTAQSQTNAPYRNCLNGGGVDELQGSVPFFIPTNVWANLSSDQPVAHLLFDAVSRGSGQLVIAIYKNDGVTKVAECPQPLYLKLQDLKEMYERYTVGEDPTVAPATTANVVADPYSYDTTIPADNNYILFVHGWNLPTWEKDAFAETAFKRLYWQGYKGHFGEFRWPTGYGFSGIINVITDAHNYDNSESNAWASATGLFNKLADLNSQYPGHVNLIAHSMGNVVADEALKQAGSSQLVNTYVAMQGAVPAHCYDPTTANRAAVNLPDFYAYYPTYDAPSYFSGTAGAGNSINFYNEQDWALGYWGVDQNLKPDSGYLYSANQFYRGTFFTTPLYFPTNTYEIFAYCDPAPCFALGAQANVGSVFAGNQLDLFASPFNFGDLHKGHSGEFNSDSMSRWSFWQQFLVSTKLTGIK